MCKAAALHEALLTLDADLPISEWFPEISSRKKTIYSH